MSARLKDWLKRCVTRRFLLLFELGMMAVIGVGVAVSFR